MHRASGRWRLGLVLSLCTALLWGVLPIALKEMLRQLDAFSLTFYRFVAATLVLGLWLALRRRLPDLQKLRGRLLLLMAVASLGLVGNYVCYLLSVRHISPSGAQVLIQMAPLLLLLGSVWITREPFSPRQWLGFCAFGLGLVLFFNGRLGTLMEGRDFTAGVLWMVAASVTWAAYAMAQKQLLKTYASPATLVIIYTVSGVLLLPFSDWGAVLHLDRLGYWLLAFCCVNTLLAYGAFAEALAHWEASRVSATLAVTPLITIFASLLMNRIWPGGVATEPLNLLSYLGAAMVVGGSALTALAR